jgi:O-acetyl-ADP-ribose deacetylase (regulator of RNase III)/transcriptional regulator with XRE-family HTH domain
MDVDAIVNAANTSLQAGGGVCGAIFSAAGTDKLQRACDNLAPIQTGEAVITKGYALPAKYIIHAAGPIYRDGKSNEEELLRSCYKNALDLAKKHRCDSVAFPLISSGIYGYPKDEALAVATNTISIWLMDNDMDVSLVVFDKTAFALSQDLLGGVKAFISENYVDEKQVEYGRSQRLFEATAFEADALIQFTEAMQAPPQAKEPTQMPAPVFAARPASIEKFAGRLDEPFSATLLRLIDAKGKSDVEIYKRANLDRKLFSKIRTGKSYMPSKKTAVALAVALELSLSETRDLLERAGFALSRSVMFDVIIEYFITRRHYDIFEINNVLFEYDQPLLGG